MFGSMFTYSLMSTYLMSLQFTSKKKQYTYYQNTHTLQNPHKHTHTLQKQTHTL